MPDNAILFGKRYQLLDQLGSGGMGVVYRAADRLTGQTIALKQMTTDQFRLGPDAGDSTDVRLGLAHEFRMLSSLRHPNIISVLDYGFDARHQPYFTMDLLENAQTLLVAGRGKPLADQLALLMQVFQALAYLHRRGILHRDLKPGNVLVIGEQVKVLDFGLSTMRDEAGGASGTLAYIAPEQLQGEKATEASDLYAVGMMAYELFAGRHPFQTDNINALIDQVLHTTPDVRTLDLDERLTQVLERLLTKQPSQRYGDAREIIAVYHAATNRQLPYETTATRESFLQAARFVGRDVEFAQLANALKETKDGHGSAWLVGGESGVGKSRLLDEVRSLALVRGAAVLRGQAVSEGGRSYQIWREVLRWMVLLADLSDREASVFKALAPDIDALLGRTVADAPEVDPQATQDRLLSAIEAVFERQREPIVVVLEDIHWAGSESLAVLERLARRSKTLPILFIASYRDDERPDLPKDLPGCQHLKLGRLTETSIATLSESMLGAAGRQPQVVQLLQRETEGNVFFLVEVVRALAEEAGQLDRVGSVVLPETVFAGGMQVVLQRRLNRVPETARPLLQRASVAGRQLDLRLLRTVDPNLDITQWLDVCSSAAVLDVQDGQWLFAHDKLRETLLASLPTTERRAIHRQVAEALEKTYPGSAEQFANLAYHWGMAGDDRQEAHYAALAGEQALDHGIYQAAVKHLQRALELGFESPQRRAHLEQQLSEAYYGLGYLRQSEEHSAKALDLLGWPMPTIPARQAVTLLGQALRQTLHRLLPGLYLGRGGADREKLLEGASAYERLAVVNYMFNAAIASMLSTFYALNLAEAAGTSPQLARSYANTGVAVSLVPLHKLAKAYGRKAEETAPQESQSMRWVLSANAVYDIGIGDWDPALDALTRAGRIATNLGDNRGFEEVHIVLSMYHYHRGNFERSREVSDILYNSAVQRGDIQNQTAGTSSLFANRLRLGNAAPPDDLFARLEKLLATGTDLGQRILGYGLLSVAYRRLGKRDQALRAAEEVTRIIFGARPTSYYSLVGYTSVADTYLALWEAGDAAQAETAKQVCKSLRGYAGIFPFGRPAALRSQGLYEWLSGQPQKAQGRWQAALAEAERLQMPYEESLCHYEIGRHLDRSDPDSKTRLERAQDIFGRLCVPYDLELTQAALRSLSGLKQ